MMFGGVMVFAWIFWIIVLAALIWFLIYLANPGHILAKGPKSRYMDILKERFARGEISREEYEQTQKALKDN